ncbi:outer membrane protein [Helicobacter cynogastricus]|uniref:outer membrane protein n=1 Tax=Helicobacter cynogastricus TaxID=329937 RepID=UPI001F36946E|nr:outer membrane protein [Helicobacter cynogastricus]
MRPVLLVVLAVGLSAESSGFYAQVGFQYSNATQDSAASKTDIQTFKQALQTRVNFEKAFPPHHWTAPSPNTIPFEDKQNNPYEKSKQYLQDLVNWEGKPNIDIDALKASYQQNAEQLMSAWIAYTIEKDREDAPNAPNSVVGNILGVLGELTAMNAQAKNTPQVPQLEPAFKAFEATSQQVAKALGVNDIFFLGLQGSATISALQTQVSDLGNAADTLNAALLNALTDASSQKPVVSDVNQREKLATAIQDQYSQVSVLAQALQKVLKERYGISPAMQHRYSNSNLYGVNVQAGYKQFFGSSKRWGLRYYGSFSYNWGEGSKTGHGIDSVIYGAGVDGLFNFFESKDHNLTSGVFLGLMFVGSTWVNNNIALRTTLDACKNDRACTPQMRSSYFQLPLTFDFRANIGAHNGFEIGTRIPLLPMPYYYASMATSYGVWGTYKQQIGFKRNASVYFNYVFNF